MRRYLVPIFLLLMAVAVAAMQLAFGLIRLPLSFTEQQTPQASKTPAPQRLAALPEAPSGARPEQASPAPASVKPQSEFDIARIDPGGTSVFAGKSSPKVWVTVLADGKPVGTTRADDNGEWTLVTTSPMPASPRLAVATANEAPPAPKIAAATPVPAAGTEPKAQVSAQPSADAVGRDIVGRLEAMVAEARAAEASRDAGSPPPASRPDAEAAAPTSSGGRPSDMPAETGGTSPSAAQVDAAAAAIASPRPPSSGASALPPAAPPSSDSRSDLATADGTVAAPRNERQPRESRSDASPAPAATQAGPTPSPKSPPVQAADATPGPATTRAATQAASFAPIPIMFHYREARFTDEGRKAAELLLEYVRLKHLGSLRLTGHADERGTVELNMDLSRDRLDTVSRFLRDGGYQGTLDMIPKGKSEPFAGVDRTRYSQDVLYQLDRRVELRAGG